LIAVILISGCIIELAAPPPFHGAPEKAETEEEIKPKTVDVSKVREPTLREKFDRVWKQMEQKLTLPPERRESTYIGETFLEEMLKVIDITQSRLEGMWTVGIMLRNTTDAIIQLEYKIAFYTSNGTMVISEHPEWRSITLDKFSSVMICDTCHVRDADFFLFRIGKVKIITERGAG
jgi:hypothetical protein